VGSVWQHIHERLGTWKDGGLVSLEAFMAGRISYLEFAWRDTALWKGVSREHLERIVSEIPLRPGARETVEALRREGYRLALLSSGLDVLADRVAASLGFELCIANRLGFRDGVLDGRVTIQVTWAGKPRHVANICRALGVDPWEVAAIGDSMGDALVFPAVGLGIAFNAPPEVEARADYAVRNNDLRAVLSLLSPRSRTSGRFKQYQEEFHGERLAVQV
jgi:phosphoserine phosphatase